jgi:hypothetical protein
MKLSEQYSRKINELSIIPVQPKKEVVKKEEEESFSWLPEFDIFDPMSILTYVGTLGALAIGGRQMWFKFFGRHNKKYDRKGWLERARAFRGQRLHDKAMNQPSTRHVSESMYRHMMNLILQKDLHTMDDVVNKVKSGKMSVDLGYNTIIARFTGLSATQRETILKDLYKVSPKAEKSIIPKTTGATNPYYGYTSTTSGTKPLTGPLDPTDISNLSGAEKLARSRKNIK